jgi:hypothetical protein
MIPATGRDFVVFGSAGLRDPEKRILMGQTAADSRFYLYRGGNRVPSLSTKFWLSVPVQ